MGNTLSCRNGRCNSEFNPKRHMRSQETLLKQCHNCGMYYPEKKIAEHPLNDPGHQPLEFPSHFNNHSTHPSAETNASTKYVI